MSLPVRAAGEGCSTADDKLGAKGDGKAMPSTGLVLALPGSLLFSYTAVQPPNCPTTQAATKTLTKMLVLSSVPQTTGLRVKRMQNEACFLCKNT